MRKNIIIRIIPFVTTFLIMAAIFAFSAQNAEQSSQVSRGLTAKIVDVLPMTKNLLPAGKEEAVLNLHNFIRKCAHFSIYFLLGISASAMFLSAREKMSALRIWLCCITLCFVYASSDEIHQLFVSGRGAMFRDVLLDTCGGAVGGAVFAAVRRLLKRKR